jgi:nicotinamide mononucleotide transporter
MLDFLADHWLEIFGFVTGALCVFLAARRNIWTFPLGLASNVVYIVVFFEVALYADMGLQVVYIVLGVTGWIGWQRSRAVDDRATTVRMPRRAIPVLVVALVAGAALLTLVLTTFTDSTTPVPDAATTTASLVAQFMLNSRWIENWFVWIAVDVAYIGLYAYKELYITAALYLIFIGICVHGYRTWRRAPHEVAAAHETARA